MKKKHLYYAFIALLLVLGVCWRLYHIEFGLPHSFHADEPEIAELAIKYTYEIRSIIGEGDYYKLIPINFVYGTFPAYLFTFATMGFSKFSNLVNFPFDKTTIYIFLRSLNAIISMGIVFAAAVLYKKTFSRKEKFSLGVLLTAFFLTFNWKLIVHAHYLNVDIILTLLLSFSYVAMVLYYYSESDTKYTVLSGILVGLAFGTKVTALLTLPLYIMVFVYKKDFRNLFAFLFLIFGAFVASNPFSLAFAKDFTLRMYMLLVKENGLVFDSVDLSKLKYIRSLNFLITPFVFLSFVYGSYLKFREKSDRILHVFLVGSVVLYVLFFTLGTRRVDRWLLPVLPIVFVYGSYGLVRAADFLRKSVSIPLLLVVLGAYLYFPMLLLFQFQSHTPKSEAYLWMRDNVSDSANKLVITKEGLDPMNKLEGVYVDNFEVYESEAAQFALPENPLGYDYVVLSSRPLESYKRKAVRNRYEFYYTAWKDFEDTVLDENKFELVKSFTLPKPNLVELSDVYIYKNLNPPNPDIVGNTN